MLLVDGMFRKKRRRSAQKHCEDFAETNKDKNAYGDNEVAKTRLKPAAIAGGELLQESSNLPLRTASCPHQPASCGLSLAMLFVSCEACLTSKRLTKARLPCTPKVT